MDTIITSAKLSLVGIIVIVILVLSFARKPTPEQLQAVLVLLAIRGLGNSARGGSISKEGAILGLVVLCLGV